MPVVKSGDIRQFVVGGRELQVKSGDANINIRLGGFANEAQPGGSGSILLMQRRKLAGFSDCPVLIDSPQQDLEYLQGLADTGDLVPTNITLASGIVYSGQLVPVGDLDHASGDGTLSLEMRGPKFEQI